MPVKERKTYLWLEDREGKSSYTFWKTIMSQIAPDVIVESKKNNSELVKAVKQLKDEENRYIIVFDNSFDNPQIYREHRFLKKKIQEKENVKLLEIICFEYLLLEFDELINWIYAPDDEYLRKREVVIKARKKLLGAIESRNLDYKVFQEIVLYDQKLREHNMSS